MSAPRKTIAVLGGGITGLTAAYRLTQQGHRVRLFETGTRLGGVIRTERTADGWLIESGPNSFQENSREVAALLTELGLDQERVVAAPAAKNRYIVRDGKLQAVPMSPFALLGTSLFSFGSKLRLLKEVFRDPQERLVDVSLANFVRDHFGPEIVDYALNPFVSGVYAGDPAKLSAQYAFPKLWDSERTHGSLIRGQIAQAKARRAKGDPKPRIISFRDGLQTLTDRLAQRLPAGTVELSASVDSLQPSSYGSPWMVRWTRDGTSQTEEFSAVILALPAASLAKLTFVNGSTPYTPLAPLTGIVHPPVASLFLGFRREQVAHPLDGFGALIPAAERRNLLGVLFSSSLFPGRAPEDHVALTVMIGGSLRPDLTQLPENELTDRIMPELRTLLGVTGDPVFRRLNTSPRAIPQYNLGYERFLEIIETCEQTHQGPYIGGQVRHGIALPACVESGLTLAERAAR